MNLRNAVVTVFILCSTSYGAGVFAADDLGEAATNPVSNLVQFRLQNQYTASSHNADSWGNAAIVQTVVPIPSLADNFDSLKGIVTRVTAPYISTPDLDGVVLAIPPHLHVPVATEALRRGRPVLVEKPLFEQRVMDRRDQVVARDPAHELPAVPLFASEPEPEGREHLGQAGARLGLNGLVQQHGIGCRLETQGD